MSNYMATVGRKNSLLTGKDIQAMGETAACCGWLGSERKEKRKQEIKIGKWRSITSWEYLQQLIAA